MLLGVFFQGLPPGLCRAATPLKSHEKFIVRGFGGGGAWAGQEGGSLFLPPSAPPLPVVQETGIPITGEEVGGIE